MWVPILVVVLVIAMAVGPVMWFRATPAQKRIIGFRNRAAELGLKVRLVAAKDLELPVSDPMLSVSGYGLPWQRLEEEQELNASAMNWRLVRERISHASHFSGVWNWQRGRAADPQLAPFLRQLIEELPRDAVALEGNRQGIWLYWQERGAISEVDRVAELLQRIHQQARSCHRPPAAQE